MKVIDMNVHVVYYSTSHLVNNYVYCVQRTPAYSATGGLKEVQMDCITEED